MHIAQRSGSIYLIDYVEIHTIQVIESFQNLNFRLCIQTSSQMSVSFHFGNFVFFVFWSSSVCLLLRILQGKTGKTEIQLKENHTTKMTKNQKTKTKLPKYVMSRAKMKKNTCCCFNLFTPIFCQDFWYKLNKLNSIFDHWAKL